MKKFVTFVLTAAMAVSAFSVNVFADDTTAPAAETAVAEAPAETEAAVEAEEPTEAEAAVEAEELTEAETPVEAEEPAEAETPAEAEEPAEAETPAEAEEPAEVETPAEPVAPVAPATAKAVLSNAKVAVNGTAVEFQAYNIGGNNYFKLRDVAVAVDGTVANFEVGYDKETKAITLTKGTAYTGSKEAATATAGDKTAKLSTQVVVLDGAEADLTAYNIDGYNYFKLRDLGTALGFEVTWDSEAKLIGIAADALEVPAEPETPAEAEEPAETEAPAEDAEAPAETEAPAEDAEAPVETPAEDAEAPVETEAPAEDAEVPAETEAPAEA